MFTHVALLATDRHFPRPTGDDVLRRARSTYTGRIVLGENLMTIDIDGEVKVHRDTPGGRGAKGTRRPASNGPSGWR